MYAALAILIVKILCRGFAGFITTWAKKPNVATCQDLTNAQKFYLIKVRLYSPISTKQRMKCKYGFIHFSLILIKFFKNLPLIFI
jgi:hypothetical protein